MGRVELVTDRESVTELCGRVFSTMDPNSFPFRTPSGLPFTDGLTRGAVFRTVGFRLTPRQYQATVGASRAAGDCGFFLGCTEDPSHVCVSPAFDAAVIYWCEYPDHAEYEKYLPLVETFIVSPSAAWGVLLSEEMFGFVGGRDEFMSRVNQEYDWRQDLPLCGEVLLARTLSCTTVRFLVGAVAAVQPAMAASDTHCLQLLPSG